VVWWYLWREEKEEKQPTVQRRGGRARYSFTQPRRVPTPPLRGFRPAKERGGAGAPDEVRTLLAPGGWTVVSRGGQKSPDWEDAAGELGLPAILPHTGLSAFRTQIESARDWCREIHMPTKALPSPPPPKLPRASPNPPHQLPPGKQLPEVTRVKRVCTGQHYRLMAMADAPYRPHYADALT